MVDPIREDERGRTEKRRIYRNRGHERRSILGENEGDKGWIAAGFLVSARILREAQDDSCRTSSS